VLADQPRRVVISGGPEATHKVARALAGYDSLATLPIVASGSFRHDRLDSLPGRGLEHGPGRDWESSRGPSNFPLTSLSVVSSSSYGDVLTERETMNHLDETASRGNDGRTTTSAASPEMAALLADRDRLVRELVFLRTGDILDGTTERDELMRRVVAERQELVRLRADLEQTLDLVQRLKAELREARARVTDIESSTSWRITAPLRRFTAHTKRSHSR
jgi:hypothetical protein